MNINRESLEYYSKKIQMKKSEKALWRPPLGRNNTMSTYYTSMCQSTKSRNKSKISQQQSLPMTATPKTLGELYKSTKVIK